MAAPQSGRLSDRMEGGDKRHRKLLMLQKKMQMTDAMEKKLQMSSKKAGGSGKLSSSLLQSISSELDKAISSEDFRSSPVVTPTRRSSSRSKSEMSILNRSSSGSISLAGIESSPFLQAKIAAMERSGKIKPSPSKSPARMSPAPRRNKRTSIQESRSLPDINATQLEQQAGPTVELPTPTFLPSAPSPSPKAAGGNKFKPPPMSNTTKKRFAQSEVMIKQAVQRNSKDLKLLFSRADADGSGELDAEELKSVLFKVNIIFEERHFNILMAQIDKDGSGTVSWPEFLKYFGKGNESDLNVTRKVGNVTTAAATQMIREKITSKLEGGPAGLRRAFQLFDRDGGGSISKEEFAVTLRRALGLEFEAGILDRVLKDASAEMDYAEFTQFVMGSSARDSSSLGFTNEHAPATDDNGNSEQMLRRKIREFWKPLHVKFKHADPDGTGKLTPFALNDILFGFDICFPPQDFKVKCKALDVGKTGKISYQQFLAPYSKGSNFDTQVVTTIKGVTKAQAKEMILEKLQGRIQGGPAGLRRAFRFFDRDGSNAIDLEELTTVVTKYLGMAFEPAMLAELHKDFAGGKAEIDLHSFTKYLLGSTRSTSTSLDSRSLMNNAKSRENVSDSSGNSDQFILRKVREHWKDLQYAFQHADRDGSGIITPADLRQIIESFDIILADSQFETLLKKLDTNGDGDISYEEFFSYFRQGQKASTGLNALVGVIKERDCNVLQAQELIRDKMRGKLAGGPSELRRTFQLFDQDGGGTIDVKEFEMALHKTCGLKFEGQLIKKVMNAWSKGTGELSFQTFTEGVMDSKQGDSTSFGQHMTSTMTVSNDNGNSLQFIIRKVRERFTDLKVALRHACENKGYVTPKQLRDVLFRFDIVLTDGVFNEIVKKIDENGDGEIQYTEFTNMFGPGRADDKDKISTIKNMRPEKALELIRDKVRGRLASGPGEQRRAFAFFDRDGSGFIDLKEFEAGLASLAGLRFDEKTVRGLMNLLDHEGTGGLNFVQFTKYVIGSKGDSAETSFVNDSGAKAVGSTASGNSAMMLRRKIREKWKLLITDFKHKCSREGDITPKLLKDILYKHDIIFSDKDFEKMCKDMDTDGDGSLSYQEFLNFFKPGQRDEKMTAAEIKTMPAAQAITMIREKIESRLAGGPAGLRRAWRSIDRKSAGTVFPKEFAAIVRKVVGCNLNDETMAAVISVIDDDSSGQIDYRKFCEHLMGSSATDQTGVSDMAGSASASAANGNSMQFLIRKIRMGWKQLIQDFKHASRASGGNLTPAQLKDVLYRHDIIFADKDYDKLCKDIDTDGDGNLSYDEFLSHFAVGSEADKAVITTIRPMPIEKAKNLIRTSIEQKLDGGEGGLRKAFHFFDRDKSGAIDLEEFNYGLQRYCGLQFEDAFLKQLMAEFHDGSGQINYACFAERVMGSSSKDATGFSQPAIKYPDARPSDGPGIGKNTLDGIMKFTLKRLEAKSGNIATIFRKFDDDKSGSLSYDEFRKGLNMLGIPLNNAEFAILTQHLDHDGGGQVDYREFVAAMRHDDTSTALVKETVKATKGGASRQEAIGIGKNTVIEIEQFVVDKLEAKSGNVAKLFRDFDDDKSGSLSYDEFREGLLKLGIPLNDAEFNMFVQKLDSDGSGQIDYLEFVKDIRGGDMGGAIVDDRPRPAPVPAVQPQDVTNKGLGLNSLNEIKAFIQNKCEARSTETAKVFRDFDEDHSGRLSFAEFRSGLNVVLGAPLSDREWAIVFNDLKMQGENDVDYVEFVAEMVSPNNDMSREQYSDNARLPGAAALDTEAGTGHEDDIYSFVHRRFKEKGSDLASLFLKFDEDRSGGIDYEEVRKGLLRMGVPLNDAEFSTLMSQWDQRKGSYAMPEDAEANLSMSFDRFASIAEDTVMEPSPLSSNERSLEILRQRLRDGGADDEPRLSSRMRSGQRGSNSSRRSSRSSARRKPSLASSVGIVGDSLVLGHS